MDHTNECLLINSCLVVFFFFFNFGHAAKLRGSQFPDKGLNLGDGSKMPNLNYQQTP